MVLFLGLFYILLDVLQHIHATQVNNNYTCNNFTCEIHRLILKLQNMTHFDSIINAKVNFDPFVFINILIVKEYNNKI